MADIALSEVRAGSRQPEEVLGLALALSGAAHTISADTLLDDVGAPPGRRLHVIADCTLTLPDGLTSWGRVFLIRDGITVSFEFGANTVRGPDGQPVDFVANPALKTVAGPARFSIFTNSENQLEVWHEPS